MFDKTAQLIYLDEPHKHDGKPHVTVAIADEEKRILFAIRRPLPDGKDETYYEQAQLARDALVDVLLQVVTEIAGYPRRPPTPECWYIPTAEEPLPNSQMLISSVQVIPRGAHENVRIWNRGGLAGSIVTGLGDGQRVAALLGLHEAEPHKPGQNKPVASDDQSR